MIFLKEDHTKDNLFSMSSSTLHVQQLVRAQRKGARRDLDGTKNWKAYKKQPSIMKSMVGVLFLIFMARVKKYEKFFSV